MITKMAIITPAFTKKGNAKNVDKAKSAYKELGWTITQEYVGSLSDPSYLIVEAQSELPHPKKPIIDKVEEVDLAKNAHDKRLSEIKLQIINTGLQDTSFIGSEIDALPNLLTDEEQILGAIGAIIDSNKWFIICTQSRILMIDKGMFRSQQKEVQIKDIDAIETNLGFFNGEIEIKTKASNLTITKALPADAEKFVTAVREAMASAKSTDNTPKDNSVQSNDDISSQLTKLADLKTAGALTDEEFAEAKAKILGS